MDHKPSGRDGGGDSLMQELEAISQVLKKGGQEVSLSLSQHSPLGPFSGVPLSGIGEDLIAQNNVGVKSKPSAVLNMNAPVDIRQTNSPMSRKHTSSMPPRRATLGEPKSSSSPRPKASMSMNDRRFQGVQAPVDLPAWLQDNKKFSKRLEAPIRKRTFLNWKPLRALVRLGAQKSQCEFSLHVHGIKNLPESMNGQQLQVVWKRNESAVETRPAVVAENRAEFEATLRLSCTLYGGGSGSYMPKSSVLRVLLVERGSGLLVGNHKLDLSLLLPEGGDGRNGSPWTSEFPLQGKCQGSSLVVSFGYKVVPWQDLRGSQGRVTPSKGSGSSHSSLSLPMSRDTFETIEKKENEQAFNMETFPTSPPSLPESTSPPQLPMIGDSEVHSASRAFKLSPPRAAVVEEEDRESSQGNMSDGDLEGGNVYVEDIHVEHEEPADDVDKAVVSLEGPTSPEVVSLEGPTSPEVKDWRRGWGLPSEVEAEEEKDEGEPEVTSIPAEIKQKGIGIHHDEEEEDEEEGEEEFDEDEEEYDEEELVSEEEEEDSEEDVDEESEVDVDPADIDGKVESRQLLSEDLDVDREKGEAHELSEEDELDEDEESSEDDLLDEVAGEFLEMLEGADLSMFDQALQERKHAGLEAESPHTKLWREFEQGSAFGGGMPPLPEDEPSCSEPNEEQVPSTPPGFGLADFIGDGEMELERAGIKQRSRTRAQMLEDEENAALMRKMGLNAKVFEESSPPRVAGVGDTGPVPGPLGLLRSGGAALMPLGKGLGPVVSTRDGGSLRSMSAGHFEKTSGALVMQVSKPVVVPPEMGSTTLEIMQRMAALGAEGMARQAFMAMPLDDVSGMSIDQIAAEGRALEGPGQRSLMAARAAYGPLPSNDKLALEYGEQIGDGNGALAVRPGPGGLAVTGGGSGLVGMSNRVGSGQLAAGRYGNGGGGQIVGANGARELLPGELPEECVSLEELAPLAMRTIEALAMQGLRMQSGEEEEDAPFAVDAIGWGDVMPQLEARARQIRHLTGGKAAIAALGGPAARKLLANGKSSSDEASVSRDEEEEVDAFGMAISLEEWMRLDAGVATEEEVSASTLAVLAAHGSAHGGAIAVTGNQGRPPAARAGGAGGYMGNTLTLAMLVQLRDPTRNYEPVGAPMMALVQAERVLVPPVPRLGRVVPEPGMGDRQEDDQHNVPKFKITGVSMCGLKNDTEGNKKKGWGGAKQQQAGSKWLAANGMVKGGQGKKHPLLKEKSAPAKVKVKTGESLWSISARVHGTGSKWKDIAALNPHIRDPDVIFTNDTIRTR